MTPQTISSFLYFQNLTSTSIHKISSRSKEAYSTKTEDSKRKLKKYSLKIIVFFVEHIGKVCFVINNRSLTQRFSDVVHKMIKDRKMFAISATKHFPCTTYTYCAEEMCNLNEQSFEFMSKIKLIYNLLCNVPVLYLHFDLFQKEFFKKF